VQGCGCRWLLCWGPASSSVPLLHTEHTQLEAGSAGFACVIGWLGGAEVHTRRSCSIRMPFRSPNTFTCMSDLGLYSCAGCSFGPTAGTRV
jgi:hypothetical protein